MTDLISSLFLFAALAAIYGLFFRSIFGKHLSATPLSTERPGPAWGLAMLGGFAASDIAQVMPSTATVNLTLTLAVVVGGSCGLRARGLILRLPAGILGAFAAVVSAIQLVASAPTPLAKGTTGLLLAAMALLFLLLLTRRGAVLAGLAWFGAVELVTFMAEPTALGLIDWVNDPLLATGLTAGALLVPPAIAALDKTDGFLNMFSVAVSLVSLLAAFQSPGKTDFLLTTAYLACSMGAFLFTTWLRRGFGGRPLRATR